MARGSISYDKRMMQRLARDREATPEDWAYLADKHTRVYRIEYSSPVTGATGRGTVLALHGLHAAAVLQRRLEAVVGASNVDDYAQNLSVLRLGPNEPWAVAEETAEERTARLHEMARIWMGGHL